MFKFALTFALLTTLALGAKAQKLYQIVETRSGLPNVFIKLKLGRPITIAYFGGSITAGAGASDAAKTSWRAKTTAWFKTQFPKAAITEVDASIGGTGSSLGAFRLQRDVLDKNPDLVFVEYAVNDMGTPDETVDRAMDGIVRQIRRDKPYADICFIYTLHKDMLADFKAGKLPPIILRHEYVAAHYRLASVDLGAAAAERIQAGQLTWDAFSKDVCHPTDAGYQLYADTLTGFLAECSLHTPTLRQLPYRISLAYRTDAWEHGRLVEAASLPLPSGWSLEEKPFQKDWPRALASNTPNSQLTYPFTGDTIGLYYILGPDTGNLDYKIDDGDWKALTPFDDFSLQYARPQYRILADHLASGKHTVTLRIRPDSDARSKGHWTRLAFFMLNAPP
ncbi:MAG TPA: GDSL-type esterase/lipase family protein [Chthonomonadaceae bacterium]|nr:GDSL-type esterase/lipase family protein [Chthonomonadaceae bacterium]